ncbi:two component transcriptional regulator, winged helix family [Geobacter metallireducens RCH3]|uniref:Winged-helix transcriptional response regulator n=1 Tax=Geobacter metallireducens (strain ATCC 53774 / DSM 7210 / GS-15) TaxID=269799 RepID=Q39WV7_GEOMG|nr:response regulator transcription factor [Geobacter metallireducens]ABB31267.1 winged-helix transcriptional response regulator [Geobacter metallireducens GS-15]EHP86511.1 two component transcriptional regulator, winged helix family [Geobacter metallireducens RCH3]
MKILIIEDEKRMAGILKKGLEENAFIVDLAGDGEEGLYMAENYPYDAVLLDIMLPVMDGLSILSALRSKRSEVPVLLITARGEIESRIKGLNFGADDYIVKPFDFHELLARLKSVIRRSKGRPSPLVAIDDLSLDTNSRSVCRGGREIRLSATEYNLLEYLALNSGRVISRTELTEHIYDTDFDRDSNVIDVYVNHLRNKLDKGFDRQLIHTVRGAGYILKGDA